MKFFSVLWLIVVIVYASGAAVCESAAQSQAISKARSNAAAKLSAGKYKANEHPAAIDALK